MTLINTPRDTRLVEFLSAAAFLISAIALFAYPERYFADVRLTYIKALFATIGILQMIPIFLGKDGMLLKTIMCLTAVYGSVGAIVRRSWQKIAAWTWMPTLSW